MPIPLLLWTAGVGLATLYMYMCLQKQVAEEAYGSAPSEESRYEPEICGICQEKLLNPKSMRSFYCAHSFHTRCIDKYIEDSPYPAKCPKCHLPLRLCQISQTSSSLLN